MDNLTLRDYWIIFKRHKKYFLLTFCVLWIISFVFALCWSNYRSTATIEIEQPVVAQDVTSPTNGGMSASEMAESLADLRISKIQQKVTAPASLIDVITKFSLYPNAKKITPMASIADRMRGAVKLDLISSTINSAAVSKVSADQLAAIAFTISFDYNNPQLAQNVTDELVTRFLDEDLKERRAEAEETSAFLQVQITAMEASMAEQEKKISDFQQEHGVSGPEMLMFNQQASESTMMSLQNLDSQIAANEGTQGSLRSQLATIEPYTRVIADGQVLTTPATQLKAMQAQYSTLTAQYGPNHPDVVKLRHQIDSLKAETGGKGQDTAEIKAQITDVKTNLAAAQKTRGAKSPDVVALQHKLKSLEDTLAAGDHDNSRGSLKGDADNPAYLELVSQLRASEEQHKSLESQRESLSGQQQKYQQAVAKNPILAQQMAVLTRDYDNSQLRYRELRERKMAADMDVQMVQERKGQRLTVISPPELPLKTHPSRIILLLAGLIISLAGGLASVVFAQAMSQSIVGSAHLTSLIGVPPLVTIPHLYTRAEKTRVERVRPYVLGATIVVAIMLAVVFNYAVMPLDVLWGALATRFGLS